MIPNKEIKIINIKDIKWLKIFSYFQQFITILFSFYIASILIPIENNSIDIFPNLLFSLFFCLLCYSLQILLIYIISLFFKYDINKYYDYAYFSEVIKSGWCKGMYHRLDNVDKDKLFYHTYTIQKTSCSLLFLTRPLSLLYKVYNFDIKYINIPIIKKPLTINDDSSYTLKLNTSYLIDHKLKIADMFKTIYQEEIKELLDETTQKSKCIVTQETDIDTVLYCYGSMMLDFNKSVRKIINNETYKHGVKSDFIINHLDDNNEKFESLY